MSRPAGQHQAAIRTFLISDIRGYTSFTAERGDEAASRLAAKFAEVCTQGVEAWGGVLLELRGDEALAVFQSARSALRAAVELQAAFAAETQLEPELPLGVGIGLDAGEAVPVGEGYRGAALNLAARLCSAASAGQITASQNLIHLAGPLPDLVYFELGPTSLKGLEEPVAAVRVEGAAAVSALVSPTDKPSVHGPLPTELEAIVPLAGRETELRWLAWHWRRAAHGSGRVAVLSGAPGMGKTRLASELGTLVHADGATVIYLPAAAGADKLDVDSLGDGPGHLVIVDDLDAAPAAAASFITALARRATGRRVLLLVTHRREAARALTRLVEAVAPDQQRRQLEGLELDAVRSIAALYAGQAVDGLPLGNLLQESGGVPAAIHQLASAWARSAATERLAASARVTSSGRRSLHRAQEELISSVTELELARERTGLYGVDRSPEDESAPSMVRLDICPYKGLAAFETSDAGYYFGRERLIAELVARLVGSSFVGLIGASGSGKSSALRAGLLPALAGGVLPGSDTWPQVLLRPGERPMAELAQALVRALAKEGLRDDNPVAAIDTVLESLPAGGRLVVVVDQFEEIFNATRDESERQAFVDLLTTKRSGLKVVVAVRADHYGHCAAYPDLAGSIGANQVLVGRLTRAELTAVIEHPARRVGLRVEPGLTEAMLDDIGDEPGALPLLSTALLELWQTRVHGQLSIAAYRATGGASGAVARLAEAAYGALDDDQRQIARAIFLRLAGPGEAEGVVRRRVSLDELDAEPDPSVAAVLDRLTDARLVTSGEGFIEVAHEALLREWPRLQDWLAEDAVGRAVRLHLMGAALDWDRHGREPGDLYRGARLAAALDWADDHASELNARERSFLAEGRTTAEAETEQQRRTNRRLRILLAGATVFLIAAVSAGSFALLLRGQAEDEARLATARQLAASAQANLETDSELSILLAIEAAETTRQHDGSVLREAEQALHDAIGASRVLLTLDGVGVAAALSPDGRRLITVDVAVNAATVRDATTGEPLATLTGHAAEVTGVEWDAQGDLIATASADGTARLWDGATGEYQGTIPAHEGGVRSLRFSHDGTHLATLGMTDQEARVWDVASREEIGVLNGVLPHPYATGAEGIALLPDGRLAVGRGADPDDLLTVARILDVSSGRPVAPPFSGHDGFPTTDVDVSPDGTLLAAGAGAGQLTMWRIPEGEVLAAPTAHDSDVMDLEFSSDGRLLATASADGTAKLWQITLAGMLEEVLTLGGHNDAVAGVSLSRDASRLVTTTGSMARVWDVSPLLRGEALTLPGTEDFAADVVFSPDGRWIIATSGPEGVVRVFNADTGAVRLVLDPRDGEDALLPPIAIQAIDVSADGARIATASLDGTARIYDAESGENRVTFREHGCSPDGKCGVSGVAFSPDGSLVATNGHDATVRIFETETGVQVRAIEHGSYGEFAHPVAWTPDGGQLLAATLAGTHVWEAHTGKHQFVVPYTGGPAQTVAWSPDGTLVLVGGGTGPTLWDAETGTGAQVGELTTGQPTLGLAFSPDGSHIAIGGQDKNLRIWNWEMADEVLRLPVPGPGTVAFSPDGNSIAHTAWTPVGSPSTIRVFALDHDRLLLIARDRVTRSLTDDECRRYLQRACSGD